MKFRIQNPEYDAQVHWLAQESLYSFEFSRRISYTLCRVAASTVEGSPAIDLKISLRAAKIGVQKFYGGCIGTLVLRKPESSQHTPNEIHS